MNAALAGAHAAAMLGRVTEPAAPRRQRLALAVSLAVIVAAWAFELWRHATDPSMSQPPGSVGALVRSVAWRGAVRLALIAVLLRWGGEGAAAIGLRRAGLGGQLARGAGLGLVVFALGNFLVGPALRAAFGVASDGAPPIAKLFTDRADIPLWLFASVFGGGLVEELSRAFVLTRFERAGGRAGLVLGLAADTFMFGVGHLYQGLGGALTAGFSGLANAGIFLRRRSAVEAITAHAVFDVLGVILGYALYARS